MYNTHHIDHDTVTPDIPAVLQECRAILDHAHAHAALLWAADENFKENCAGLTHFSGDICSQSPISGTAQTVMRVLIDTAQLAHRLHGRYMQLTQEDIPKEIHPYASSDIDRLWRYLQQYYQAAPDLLRRQVADYLVTELGLASRCHSKNRGIIERKHYVDCKVSCYLECGQEYWRFSDHRHKERVANMAAAFALIGADAAEEGRPWSFSDDAWMSLTANLLSEYQGYGRGHQPPRYPMEPNRLITIGELKLRPCKETFTFRLPLAWAEEVSLFIGRHRTPAAEATGAAA